MEIYEEIDKKRAFDTLLRGKTPVCAIIFDAIRNEPLARFDNIHKVEDREHFKRVCNQLCSGTLPKEGQTLFVRLQFYKKLIGE